MFSIKTIGNHLIIPFGTGGKPPWTGESGGTSCRQSGTVNGNGTTGRQQQRLYALRGPMMAWVGPGNPYED